MFKAFALLSKVNAQKREVSGILSQEILDHDGEIMDYESSKPYFMAWSSMVSDDSMGKSKGNLRVMHTPKVAGKLIAFSPNDQDKSFEITAKVLDDDEWKKVLEGAYTGFSVGGQYADKWDEQRADGKKVQRFTGDPTEASLVDRPSVPSAIFHSVKMVKFVDSEGRESEGELGKSLPSDENRDFHGRWADTDSRFKQKIAAHRAKLHDNMAEAHDAEAQDAEHEGRDEDAKNHRLAAYAHTKAASAYRQAGQSFQDGRELQGQAQELETSAKKLDGNPNTAEAGKAEHIRAAKTAVSAQEAHALGDSKMHEGQARSSEALENTRQIVERDATKAVGVSDMEKRISRREDVDPKEGTSQYGDVAFADTTNHKYPIDNEEHVRAAWNYINKPDDQKEYSSSEVAEIKSKIIAAWKRKIDPKGPPSVRQKSKAVDTAGLAKGMNAVAQLACVAETLGCWIQQQVMEDRFEGQGVTTCVAKLQDILKELLPVLEQYLQEEGQELLDGITADH